MDSNKKTSHPDGYPTLPEGYLYEMEFIEEAIKGDWLLQHPAMQHRSDEKVSNQWCMLDPDRLQSKVYIPKVGETELILS